MLKLSPNEIRETVTALPDQDIIGLLYDWEYWSRPEQRIPQTDWQTWLLLAGRGFGKTRTGAETVRDFVKRGKVRRIGLVGATAADVRDVMVEGPSGILAVSPPGERPVYEPSKRRLTWPNGTLATTYSADEPERLRGPEHDLVWGDEIASWRYPEAMDNLMFGLRTGLALRLLTTTPKPTKLIKEILEDKDTFVTRGSTYANRLNLSPKFFEKVIKKYEGTRLGRQEINAEVLEDIANALWKRAILEQCRIKKEKFEKEIGIERMKRIVVSIDPNVTSSETTDEAGITVQGLGPDNHGYLLEDLSISGGPKEWAQKAVNAFHKYQADNIIGEVNNGGEMVGLTVRAVEPGIPFKAVRASRGKHVRAEPIAALYEQGGIHHVGAFPILEDQYSLFSNVGYEGSHSPDRAEAAIWGFTELMLGDAGEFKQSDFSH